MDGMERCQLLQIVPSAKKRPKKHFVAGLPSKTNQTVEVKWLNMMRLKSSLVWVHGPGVLSSQNGDVTQRD